MAWRTAEDARRRKKQGEEEEQEQETRQIYKPGVERQKRQAAAAEVNASRREQAAKLGVGYLPGNVRVPGSPTAPVEEFNGDYRHDAMLADRRAQQQSAWDVEGVTRRINQTARNGLGMIGIGEAPNSERDYMEMRRFYQLMEDAGRDSGNTELIDRARQGYGSYTARLDDIERQRGGTLAGAGNIDKAGAYFRMFRNAMDTGDLERAEYARSMINSVASSYDGKLQTDLFMMPKDWKSKTSQEKADYWQQKVNEGNEAYVIGMMTENQDLIDRAKAYTEWASGKQDNAYAHHIGDTQGAAAEYSYRYNGDELRAKQAEAEATIADMKKAMEEADKKYENYVLGVYKPENPSEDPEAAYYQAKQSYENAQAEVEIWKKAIDLEKGDEFARLEKQIPEQAKTSPEVQQQIEKGKQAFLDAEKAAFEKAFPGRSFYSGAFTDEENEEHIRGILSGYPSPSYRTGSSTTGEILKDNGYSEALVQNRQGFGMTDDQKATFFWLYATDPEKAEEFAEACKKNAEDASYAAKSAAETSPLMRVLKEFGAANMKLFFGLAPGSEMGEWATKEANAMTASVGAGREEYGVLNTGFLAGKLPEDIPIIGGKSLNDWTQLKSSMIMSGETAAAAKVAMATGHPEAAALIEVIGLYMQSGAAANDDYIRMKELGWDDDKALTHALFAGLAEGVFEKVSLENLLDQKVSRGLVRNLLTQAGVEASEEVATTIANHITDAALARVNGYDTDRERRAKEYMGQGMSYHEAYNKADVDIMTELLDDALGGFLSGGLMTGGNYASQGLMTGAGKVVSGIRNTRDIYTGANLLGMGEDVNLHQKASEGAVNQVQNDSTGGTSAALQAYAEANKISVKSKDSTRAVRANVEAVTNSIADKMYSKSETVEGRMEGAVAVYEETVSEYGEGIKPVAKAALQNTVNKIVSETSSRGSVTATTAFQAQVDAIQDPEAKQIAQAALDQAVIRKAGNATQNSERMEGLRHLTEKRHTPVKLEAIVTGTDGKETTTGIKGFSSDGSSVVLDNGTEVKVEELQTTDSDVKDAIDAIHAAKLGGLANVVFQSYLAADLSHSAKDSYRWIAGYVGAINQGITHSITVQQAVEQNARMFGLDEETVRQAYELGETLRNDPKVQARKQGLQKVVELAKEKGVKGRKAKIDTSRIQGIKISGELQAHITAVNRIAKAVGVDIVWFSSKNADGSYSAMSGKHADGTIWLDIESGKNSAGDVAIAILGTMSHELTHFIQQFSNDLYMELQDLAMQHLRQQLGEDGLEQLILDTVKKNGFTGDNAKVKAMEELTAQFCEKMFSMEESMQPVLADVQQNHKGLWAKIKEFFQGFIEKVRKLIEAGETAQKSEALQAWENITEEMQKVFATKWGEALRSAKQTHDAVTGLEAAGIQVEGIKNTAQAGGEAQNQNRMYSYEELTAKDPMRVTTVTLKPLPLQGKRYAIKEIAAEGRNKAATIGDSDRQQRYVFIDDLGENVLLPPRGFTHGITGNKTNSSTTNTAEITGDLVEILKNSIAVNELNPRAGEDAIGSYVLFGYAKNTNGDEYIVRTTVNRFSYNKSVVDSIEIYDVLKGSKAKKITDPGSYRAKKMESELIGSYAENSAAIRHDGSDSNFIISIADLLDAVKENYPTYLPKQILAKFGMSQDLQEKGLMYQTRPSDTVSDVELLLQQKVEDATNREQGRLLKEFQAKARQVQELEAKLEQAKAQLKRTDRSYNTRGIQKLIGDTMKTFGMGDAKNVGIRKTAAEMLNKAYDKAIAAIDRGDSAGALNEVYQGAVSVAEYLLDNGTYREKQGFHWDRAQWAQVYANTEEARQHAIDEVVSTVYNDFASNRYREAVQATAVDRIVDRVEAKYTEKLDAAKAQNKALQETNEKLEQDRDFFREVSDQTKDIADNLYTELKETREELKEAKRTNSKDTKRLQQKADKLAQDLKKANQQAKDWRDKAQHLGTFAQQLVASKNRDIQGLRQDLAAAHEKLQAAASQIEEMKGWEEKAKHAGVYSQQLIDSKNRDIAKLEKEIQKHRDILAGKIKNPQLMAMLKDAREAVYKERNQRIQDIRDQRKRTELRKRIVNLKEDLQRRLSKPTDGRYVPAGLAKSLIDVLDTVDNSPQAGTKAAERAVTVSERLRALADAYESIKDDPNIGWEYQSEYDEDIRNQIKALSETMQGRNLRDLSSADLQQVYDQVRQVRDIIRDAAKTMSGIEFGSLYDAMYSVANQQQSLKSLNNLGWYGRNKRMRILDNLSVMRAVEMMSGWDRSSALYQLMHAVENGADESWRWMMEYNKSLQELKTGKNEKAYRDALTKKIDFGVTDEEGERVLMTKLQALQILMTAEREAANHDLVHLQKGGAVIRDALAIQDSKANKAKSQTIKVTPELLQDIRDSLTEWDRSYMEAIHKYFAKEAKATNDVLYRLKHRVLQAEDAYVPYIVDQNYLDAKLDEQGAMTMWVRSPGSTNALKIQSPKPVIIDGMDTVMAKHVKEIADYIGMAIPIRDFSKVYNGRLQSRDNNPFPVKKAIDRTFGSKGQHLLTQAIMDVQGGSSSSWSTYFAEHLNKLQGAFVRSALLINPSVTIKQAASYTAAESILSHLALERGNHPIWTKTDESNAFMPGGLIHHIFWLPSGSTATRLYNEIDQYTSLHYQRRLGMSQTEIANEANRSGKLKRAVNSVGASMEQNAFGHAVRKVGEALDPVTWIQRMDVATTAALWVACKEQAKLDGKQVGSTEYWQRTTELYERCLRETQPMYDGLHRSANQKQHEGIMQYLFPFRTVPIQNHGQMAASYEALLAARASGDKAKIKEANRFFAKTMWAQFESAVVFASMTFLAAAMKRKTKKYRDEDEELTVESVLKGIGLDVAGTMVSNFNPLFGSAIWDTAGNIYDSVKTGKKIWSYDSFSIGPVDLLNEGMKAYGNLATDLLAVIGGKDVSWDTVKGHLNTAAVKSLKFIGLPSDTVKTYVEGTIGNLRDAFEGRIPALNDESWVRSTSTDARRFITALEAGNSFKAGNVLAGMKKVIRDANPGIKEDKLNSRVQNAINTYIHEQILSGGISDKKAIAYMVQYGGKTDDEAYWAIQEWRAKELHRGEEDYSWSPYEGLREDIDMGEKWENIKKSSLLELTEHGKTEQAIYSDIKSHIRELHAAGEITDDEAMDMLQEYHMIKDSKTHQYRHENEAEAWAVVDEWREGINNADDDDYEYTVYRDVFAAIDDGAAIDAAADELKTHGKTDNQIRDAVNGYIRDQYTGGIYSASQAEGALVKYSGKTANEAYLAVKGWKAKNDAEQSGVEYVDSDYRDLYAAIDGNKDPAAAVNDLVNHGFKEKDVYAQAKTYLRKKFVDGLITEQAYRNMLSRYAKEVKTEEVNRIVTEAKCQKETGYSLSGIKSSYMDGEISATKAQDILVKYGGETKAAASAKIRYYDFQKAYPESDLSQEKLDAYYDKKPDNYDRTMKNAGISLDTYVKYAEAAAEAKGTDKDGDGKTDSGSKKEAILQIIDGLSLTPKQKDALYYFNGWAASKIREAPWH